MVLAALLWFLGDICTDFYLLFKYNSCFQNPVLEIPPTLKTKLLYFSEGHFRLGFEARFLSWCCFPRGCVPQR